MICDALVCFPEWFIYGLEGFALATIFWGVMIIRMIKKDKVKK